MSCPQNTKRGQCSWGRRYTQVYWGVGGFFCCKQALQTFFQVIKAVGNKNRFEPVRTASEPEPEVQSKVQLFR